MRKHTAWASSLVLGVLTAIGACQSPADVPSTVDGVITQVRSDPFAILVTPEAQPCGAWFVVDSRTDIRASTSTSTVPAATEELRVGTHVRAWADGTMLLSCPGSGRAERVLITR